MRGVARMANPISEILMGRGEHECAAPRSVALPAQEAPRHDAVARFHVHLLWVRQAPEESPRQFATLLGHSGTSNVSAEGRCS